MLRILRGLDRSIPLHLIGLLSIPHIPSVNLTHCDSFRLYNVDASEIFLEKSLLHLASAIRSGICSLPRRVKAMIGTVFLITRHIENLPTSQLGQREDVVLRRS